MAKNLLIALDVEPRHIDLFKAKYASTWSACAALGSVFTSSKSLHAVMPAKAVPITMPKYNLLNVFIIVRY